MRLEGRIVIVTGASSGFGRAIAVRVAREGANVVIADLDETGGKKTSSLVHEAGGEAECGGGAAHRFAVVSTWSSKSGATFLGR